MYGSYLPFYASKDADSSGASLDAMRFMLWHSLCAEREQRILNPTNDGMTEIAKKLLGLWESKKSTIQPNEELADYIFAEETQEDADHVSRVPTKTRCFMQESAFRCSTNPYGPCRLCHSTSMQR